MGWESGWAESDDEEEEAAEAMQLDVQVKVEDLQEVSARSCAVTSE